MTEHPQKSPEEIIAGLRYDAYDPATMQDRERRLLSDLEHQRAFHALTDESWITVSDYTTFSLLNHLGWKRIGYESYLIEGGMMFWLTDVHAAALGRALRPSLEALRIDVTTLQADGFGVMADAAPDGIRLQHLYVAHKTADEVTAIETRGLARLATKLAVGTLHLWSAELEAGALDALAAELRGLENGTLTAVDMCDLTKQEPDDRIAHVGLESIVSVNRAR